MKKLLTLVFVLIFTNEVISQLYTGFKDKFIVHQFYVDINSDSTHLEIFAFSDRGFCKKEYDKYLLPNTKSNDICFQNKDVQIQKKGDHYFLLFKSSLLHKVNKHDKRNKIQLKPCIQDDRLVQRKRAYFSEKETYLRKLEDSLRGPINSVPQYSRFGTMTLWSDSLSFDDFIAITNKISDSLIDKITKKTDPIVRNYYNACDSINKLDTSIICHLLADIVYNYTYSYEKYFIYRLALTRPECLIQYVDKNPVNKLSLLRAIRNHNKYKEITNSVKECSLNTKGKKEIVRQKTKRIVTDITLGTAYLAIILSELALMTGIIIWIF
jgi:hypothetical protein